MLCTTQQDPGVVARRLRRRRGRGACLQSPAAHHPPCVHLCPLSYNDSQPLYISAHCRHRQRAGRTTRLPPRLAQRHVGPRALFLLASIHQPAPVAPGSRQCHRHCRRHCHRRRTTPLRSLGACVTAPRGAAEASGSSPPPRAAAPVSGPPTRMHPFPHNENFNSKLLRGWHGARPTALWRWQD